MQNSFTFFPYFPIRSPAFDPLLSNFWSCLPRGEASDRGPDSTGHQDMAQAGCGCGEEQKDYFHHLSLTGLTLCVEVL